jgi:hypothetical protein
MATITNIEDHGTIVVVELGDQVINFDQRSFRHFADAYNCDLREIEFETDGQMIWRSDHDCSRAFHPNYGYVPFCRECHKKIEGGK